MLILGAIVASLPALPVHWDERTVPLYPPDEALMLSKAPRAYMVDDTTCEWVQGQRLADGSLAGEGRNAALFRQERLTRPFLRAKTREDGVHVSRFQASPGEKIVARAYVIDPYTGRYIYGDATERTCIAGQATVGDPSPVEPSRDPETP